MQTTTCTFAIVDLTEEWNEENSRLLVRRLLLPACVRMTKDSPTISCRGPLLLRCCGTYEDIVHTPGHAA